MTTDSAHPHRFDVWPTPQTRPPPAAPQPPPPPEHGHSRHTHPYFLPKNDMMPFCPAGLALAPPFLSAALPGLFVGAEAGAFLAGAFSAGLSAALAPVALGAAPWLDFWLPFSPSLSPSRWPEFFEGEEGKMAFKIRESIPIVLQARWYK